MSENAETTLRNLPSVDELLRTESGRNLADAAGHARASAAARQLLDALRTRLAAGESPRQRSELIDQAEQELRRILLAEQSSGTRGVINATGVVIHTNLGRAPLPDAAKNAVLAGAGYVNLEYDLAQGRRGRRGARAESLTAELTGAEDAVIVNNGAAAAFLVLTALANGREVVISRGELVEIGGDFRVPDVLAASGAELREVGTTNRTKVSDYIRAVTAGTCMILRVHPSNFRIIGFTSVPSRADLVALARDKGIIYYEDLGSGALIDLSNAGLYEPIVGKAIEEGADIASFSGDKLLGGPQSGLIVGRRDLVEKIRRHPLYRVLRCDKLTYSALEAVLDLYRQGKAIEDIPVLCSILASADEIGARAASFVEELGEVGSMKVDVIDGHSAVGGGAAPGVQLATKLIALKHETRSADELERSLRTGARPVIVRIENDHVLLDLRTVSAEDQSALLDTVRALCG